MTANPAQPVSIGAALHQARQQLAELETAVRDSEILLCHVLACQPVRLLIDADQALSTLHQKRYDQLISARKAGQPVAYLTGRRGFWTLNLRVSPATLIPRPDTECLVSLALSKLRAQDLLLDVGTGSGAIALAIAAERPDIQVIASDISAEALTIAKGNAEEHELTHVRFCQSNLLDGFAPQSLDMVVSNPPYIAQDDPHLTQGDLRFEPLTALASGIEGLDAIRSLVQQATIVLKPGGWLMVEHGYQQSAAVQQLFQAAGFSQISAHQDYGHQDRVVAGQWPAQAR